MGNGGFLMHFHILAVGGIGMSGIARLLMQQGYSVSGNDINHSYIVKELEQEGLIFSNLGDVVKHKKVDAVVVSSAIKDNNPELLLAKQLGLPIYHRAQMLNLIVKEGRTVIGVTGAHGKTTTTALLSWILIQLGYDPLFYIGGILKEIGLNAYMGKGDFAVLELDESDGSFTLFHPEIMFITNLDLEHIDFYKTKDNLIRFFRDYITKSSNTKFILGFNSRIGSQDLGEDMDNLWDLNKTGRFLPVTYKICSDFSMRGQILDVLSNKMLYIQAGLVGEHNLYNIAGVLNLCSLLGVDIDEAIASIERFPNVQRRMDIYLHSPVTVIHDYAHHPEEIRKTLSAIRDVIKDKRLVVVFEPHRYSRFSAFWEEFKSAVSIADVVFSTPVYSASEDRLTGIDNFNFCRQIGKPAVAMQDYSLELLKQQVEDGDCVVFLGAGKIINLAKEFAYEYSTNTTLS